MLNIPQRIYSAPLNLADGAGSVLDVTDFPIGSYLPPGSALGAVIRKTFQNGNVTVGAGTAGDIDAGGSFQFHEANAIHTDPKGIFDLWVSTAGTAGTALVSVIDKWYDSSGVYQTDGITGQPWYSYTTGGTVHYNATAGEPTAVLQGLFAIDYYPQVTYSGGNPVMPTTVRVYTSGGDYTTLAAAWTASTAVTGVLNFEIGPGVVIEDFPVTGYDVSLMAADTINIYGLTGARPTSSNAADATLATAKGLIRFLNTGLPGQDVAVNIDGIQFGVAATNGRVLFAFTSQNSFLSGSVTNCKFKAAQDFGAGTKIFLETSDADSSQITFSAYNNIMYSTVAQTGDLTNIQLGGSAIAATIYQNSIDTTNATGGNARGVSYNASSSITLDARYNVVCDEDGLTACFYRDGGAVATTTGSNRNITSDNTAIGSNSVIDTFASTIWTTPGATYSIKATSAARAIGTTTPVTPDINGTPRPVAGLVDASAYQTPTPVFTLALNLTPGDLRGQSGWVDDGLAALSPVVVVEGAIPATLGDSSAKYSPLPAPFVATSPFIIDMVFPVLGLLDLTTMSLYIGDVSGSDYIGATLIADAAGPPANMFDVDLTYNGTTDHLGNAAALTVGDHTLSMRYNGSTTLGLYIDNVLVLSTGSFNPAGVDSTLLGVYFAQTTTSAMALKSITYNAPVVPTLSSLATNSAGTSITATINQSGCIPTSGSQARFTATVAGAPVAVTATAISSTTLTLTLASVVYDGQDVTLAYTTGANGITESTGTVPLAAFSDVSVDNTSTVPASTGLAQTMPQSKSQTRLQTR